MGKLREEIAEAHPEKRPSKFDLLIGRLSPEDRADLEACMADPAITTSAIFAVLQRRGHDTSYASVQRYRRRYET